MAKHRNSLPQLADGLFLTDGGIETTLVFLEGFELPYFAAFHLMGNERGQNALRDYYRRYVAIATRTVSDSSLKVRPGARVRTGRKSSGTPPWRSPTSTANRSS
jgi:S-methylmethionine-dependent homocysteine/selenocysteine methylase